MVLSSHYKKNQNCKNHESFENEKNKVNFDPLNYFTMKMVITLVKPICSVCQYSTWPYSLKYVLKTVGSNFARLRLPELVKPVATAVVSHCGLGLHVSDVTDADHFWWCWSSFVYLLAIYTSSLREMSIHIFCPFFNQSVLCFLLLSYMNSLHFWILSSPDNLQSFLSYLIK